MEVSVDDSREASGAASGGGNLDQLEAALDQIERTKQLESRLQEQVGPSTAEQVLQIVKDPAVQQMAQKVWHGDDAATQEPEPESMEPEPESRPREPGDSARSNTRSNSSVGGAGGDAVTVPVTEAELREYRDTIKWMERQDGGGIEEMHIGITQGGSIDVLLASNDGVVKVKGDDVERLRELFAEKRERDRREQLEEFRSQLKEKAGDTREAVILTLMVNRIPSCISVGNMREVAEFLGTTHGYVRTVSSEESETIDEMVRWVSDRVVTN